MLDLRQLSIADLVALHDNYWHTWNSLSPTSTDRFQLLSTEQFKQVERELKIRIKNIYFT